MTEKEKEKEELVARFDSDAAELGKIVEENDGVEEMLAPHKKMREKANTFRNIGIGCACGMATLAIGAAAGFFAADRSIGEYADKFWNLKPVH